jgi:glutamate racemase
MSRKIGILDSGVGGLSVLKEVVERKVYDEVYFLGDTKYFPYGIKKVEFIQERVSEIVEFFIGLDIEEIIIACNTASAVAYDYLLDRFKDYHIKIYSIILSAVDGIKNTNWKKIGILATRRTKESKIYPTLINKFISQDIEVYVKSCSEGPLLETIENGIIDGEIIINELKKCIDPLIDRDIDGLVLGCTHLPFVKPVIERLYHQMPIIDPSQEILRVLSRENSTNPIVKVYTTGNSVEFERIVNKLLNVGWKVEQVEIERSEMIAK